MSHFERKSYVIAAIFILTLAAAWMWNSAWTSDNATGYALLVMTVLQMAAIGLAVLSSVMCFMATHRMLFRYWHGKEIYQAVYGDIINYQAPKAHEKDQS